MRQSTRRLITAAPIARANPTSATTSRLLTSVGHRLATTSSSPTSLSPALTTASVRHNGSWLRSRRRSPWDELVKDLDSELSSHARIFPELRVLFPGIEEVVVPSGRAARAAAAAAGQSSNNVPAWSPRVNVAENDKTITVHAELPGVKKEDVKIEIKDDVLSIRGEKKLHTTKLIPQNGNGNGNTNSAESSSSGKEQETAVATEAGSGSGSNGFKYLLRETQHGQFERQIELPSGVKPEHVQAKFLDGILELEITKPDLHKDRAFRISID